MKAKDTALIRASISFPPDLYKSLEGIAKEKKVSLAWVVRDAAEKYVAGNRKQSASPVQMRGEGGTVSSNAQSLASFVWSIAEILRGDFKQSEYGKVILPFVVMRRLDCILEGSKDAVLKAAKGLPKGVDDPTKDMILFGAAGGNLRVYNLSAFTFKSLKGQDADQLHANLLDYITKFSGNVRDIFLDKFLFTDQTQAAERRRHSLAGLRAFRAGRPASRTAYRISRWAICSRI